jgi:hypothetical protein
MASEAAAQNSIAKSRSDTASIEFARQPGGATSGLRGGSPSRPGAFRVEGAPPAAGQYRWALLVEAQGLSDRHELGEVTVFAEEAAANAAAEKRPLTIRRRSVSERTAVDQHVRHRAARDAELRTIGPGDH